MKGLVNGRYQWVVFTSTNSVRAVREKFAEFGLDARAFAGVKIACVGETTASAVDSPTQAIFTPANARASSPNSSNFSRTARRRWSR